MLLPFSKTHRLPLMRVADFATRIFFCGDFHLRPEDEPVSLAALGEKLAPGDTLVILGDLLEVWIENAFGGMGAYGRCFYVLRSLADKGVKVILIPGNREVLAGRNLARLSGAKLCIDGAIFTSQKTRKTIAAFHGDELLVDDIGYQRYKSVVRSPLVRFFIKLLPLFVLRVLAAGTRSRSIDKCAMLPENTFKPDLGALAPFLLARKVVNAVAGHLHQDLTLREGGVQCTVMPSSSATVVHYRVWEGEELSELKRIG